VQERALWKGPGAEDEVAELREKRPRGARVVWAGLNRMTTEKHKPNNKSIKYEDPDPGICHLEREQSFNFNNAINNEFIIGLFVQRLLHY
jgi:hypothetical protein